MQITDPSHQNHGMNEICVWTCCWHSFYALRARMAGPTLILCFTLLIWFSWMWLIWRLSFHIYQNSYFSVRTVNTKYSSLMIIAGYNFSLFVYLESRHCSHSASLSPSVDTRNRVDGRLNISIAISFLCDTISRTRFDDVSIK